MRKFLAAVVAATVAASAIASEPHSYTYLEGAWIDRTADWDLDIGAAKDEVEGDGYSLAGSYRTEGGALFQAHYSEGDIDEAWGVKVSELTSVLGARVDFDVESWGVLMGGANQINANTSAWGGFGYGQEELTLKLQGFGSDDYRIHQYSLGGGVRYTPVNMLELNGGARIVHFRADETDLLEDFNDTDVEVSVGLRFQPIKLVSIGATYARFIDSDSESIKADVRFQF